jgi:hypothetical protein
MLFAWIIGIEGHLFCYVTKLPLNLTQANQYTPAAGTGFIAEGTFRCSVLFLLLLGTNIFV